MTGERDDYDPLVATVRDCRLVLIGEASHGTHEFYRERAAITRRLIEQEGFDTVAVEADWPDPYRVNRYARGAATDAAGVDALADFRRSPAWVWRNAVVLEFVGWLRDWNARRPAEDRVGFYGLDLYSLCSSIEAVLRYLDKVDPDAAARARRRYACLEQFSEDPQRYGYATEVGLSESCENDVVAQMVEMQRRAADLASRDGRVNPDEFFFAEHNARLVRNAEQYYRTMFRGRDDSWSLRDRHMADTLDALMTFLDRPARPSRLVVWEHNSHLGDGRATEMSRRGELNVGQLVRERHPGDCILIGQTTYRGTVTAASDWDPPAERKNVRPGLGGSYEDVLHQVGVPCFHLLMTQPSPALDALRGERLERAIGVIYLPGTERWSHYFTARLSGQFDAILHIDSTRALEPLERTSLCERGASPKRSHRGSEDGVSDGSV